MPILRGSISFSRFRVDFGDKKAADAKRWLIRGLKAHAFEPIDRKGEDDRSAGFAELEDVHSTDFSVSSVFAGERALFCWRVDQLRIPGGQLKTELEAWAQGFERENDRKPARSEKTQARAMLKQQLRAKAAPITKSHDIAWNLKDGQLQLWCTSRKIVDEVTTALEAAFDLKPMELTAHASAVAAGLDEDALKPTPEWVGLEGTEVVHGEA